MSTENYDILNQVREDHLPTPPRQYVDRAVGSASQTPTTSMERELHRRRQHGERYQEARPRRQGHEPIPVGTRCTNSLPLPPAVEAVEGRPPLAPMQQIHERTRIVNPLKRKMVKEPKEGIAKRRSTTREEKLQALDFEDNAREWLKNAKGEMVLNKPSRRKVAALIGFTESQLRDWRQDEKKILDAPEKSRRIGSGRKVEWPDMEVRLADEWRARCMKGLEITRKWFEKRAKTIFEEEYPEQVKVVDDKKMLGCEFSDGWFTGFKNRHLIAWRAPTLQAQHMPENYRNTAVSSIPRSPNEKTYEVGRFRCRLMFNFDQMGLPFDFYSTRTYAPQGAKSVKKKAEGPKAWLHRQATLALLLCGDGRSRCKPLIIFRGEAKTNALKKEMEYYDRRVERQFKQATEPEDREANLPRLLTLDTCPTHCTLRVLQHFSSPHLNTTAAFISEGLTGYLQPLDTHVNKSVKQHISDYLEEKIEENWHSDFPGKANVRVRERRILITHCVADAWEKLHNEQGDLIRKSFQQTGISLNPDGSEDHLLKVKDLPDLAKEIGGSEPGVVVNGRKSKRRTGGGLLQEDNWPQLLRLLDEKGALAQEIEAKEREEDDEIAVQV
ncbi:hypothetical protein FN846DRAFT_1013171 [Sphaerosporella brunnea]|uniref:HTH CENPB-type domain-containing protein n=1 Tax=Sphaerosporella brunnea TaxID=1250544 RepID=A0A5J5EBH0_9PEZI|nr:hypothetical protein FN846DRAFT_1013171 [Sphaerosporella brunnea]